MVGTTRMREPCDYAILTIIFLIATLVAMKTPLRALLATAAVAVVALSAACGDADKPAAADAEKINVVAAFYPLQYISEQVGGDAVTVANLAPPGAEPHDLELTPGQVAQIADADVAVYLKGFQPAVDEAIAQNAKDKAFDAAGVEPLRQATEPDEHGHAGEGASGAEEHEEETGSKDPHVWLDPTRLATIADKLAERLSAADPARSQQYLARAADLRTRLLALDGEYSRQLGTCQRREIVVSHAAFGYLAERYKLAQVAIAGLSPENEPTPQKLAEVAHEAKEHGATTVFFETLVSPKLAQTIADQVGAKAEVLDPIEGLQPGSSDDYVSVMRANLARLTAALGCATS